MPYDIAIVAAIYNPKEKYLVDQIKSYEEQYYKDFCVLFVVADRKSHGLIEKIAEQYSLSYFIVTPDVTLGPREAFGFGIQEILENYKVKFIALSDQDDVWLPHKLKILLETAEKNSASLVHCNAVIVDEHLKITKPHYWNNRSSHEQSNFELLCFRNCVIGMTCMFTVQTARIAVPFLNSTKVQPLHDWLLAIAAGMIGKIEYVDLGLVLYRQHNQNVIGANHSFRWFQFLRKFVFAYQEARARQIFIESTLHTYSDRCRAQNIRVVSLPPSSDWKRGKLLAYAAYFFKSGSLFGLLGVLHYGFKSRHDNPKIPGK